LAKAGLHRSMREVRVSGFLFMIMETGSRSNYFPDNVFSDKKAEDV
jgi:hypothetical protein